MKTNRRSLLPVLGVMIALVVHHPANAAPFTPGNLAVVRVGDGTAALTGAATATFIDEYTPAGFLVQSIAIPASGPTLLTMSGSATLEGALMRSPNGALLCFAGYQASSGTAGVATTTSAVVNREIGTVDASGSFAVAASTATQFSGNSIRSGATDGANSFWGGGTGNPVSLGGVNYLGAAAGASQVLSGNLRCVNIFNGDLYFSTGSATPGAGIHQLSGLPVIAAASTPLTVVANQSPYGFSINPAGTVMYVADDRTIASGGGIQRWDKAAGVWSLTYTLGTGGGSTLGTRGLVVNWSGASPVVYATTTEANNNRLITVTDTGAASIAALVASVGVNMAFRGVAYAPVSQRVPQPRFFTTDVLPPPNGVYVSAPEGHATYGNGLIIRNVSHKKFTQSLPPPPLGLTQVHAFNSMVEMDVSSDGGLSFQHVSAPANTSVSVHHTSDDATTNKSFFDTEMLQLDIVGGLLPGGVMVRESPTRASTGKTVTQGIGGGFMIDSFFDIFTELSIDGGQSWLPALEAVAVDLTIDPTQITPVSAPSNLWPPPNNCFASTAQNYVTFPQGIVIRRMRDHFFTQSLPPPALGISQPQTLDAQIDMEVSIDGGQTFGPIRAPASMTIQVTHRRDEGTTQIFDTEMLQLDIAGGGMPIGVMLRESPSKQSRGGTAYAVPSVGDSDFGLLRIGSFFDIFTELSLDGGQNWSPATTPGHVELQRT